MDHFKYFISSIQATVPTIYNVKHNKFLKNHNLAHFCHKIQPFLRFFNDFQFGQNHKNHLYEMKICIYIDKKGINGKPHIPAIFDILFQTDKWIFYFAYGLQFTPKVQLCMNHQAAYLNISQNASTLLKSLENWHRYK